MTISPIRVQFKTACQILDVSRESLRHIVRTDETFPKAIKMGTSKQSAVFFDYAELVEWHNKQRLSPYSKLHVTIRYSQRIRF